MPTLFISDLHLCAERARITALFLEFLQSEARAAEALYILGDLFEYWIGDDALPQPEHRAIADGLRALTTAGVPVFVMHGNRDFLIGESFCRETGCRLLADPTVVELYGHRTLLMHGDTLCTDDVEYQQVRLKLRHPASIAHFLAKNIEERETLVRGYREQSKAATSQKQPEIMDVNAGAVTDAMRDHGVQRLIHGHTHRPAVHDILIDGAPAQRYVLGDWYEQGSVLRCGPEGWQLDALPG